MVASCIWYCSKKLNAENVKNTEKKVDEIRSTKYEIRNKFKLSKFE